MEPASLLIITIIAIVPVLAAFKRFDLTPILVLSNLGIFFMLLFVDKYRVFTDLAFQPRDLQDGTGAYTLLTSMFVHYDFPHVIGNMLFLFLLGTPLESRIGKRRLGAVYLIAGIVGSILSTIYFTFIDPQPAVYTLGASGAISGAVGAFLVLYPRDEIPMFLGPIFLPRVPVWLSALSWVILDIFIVMMLPSNVSWQAHLGGFIAGMLVGLAIGRQNMSEKIKRDAPRDYSKLEALATTPQLRNAVEQIKNEGHQDVRKVWLEYFADHAPCPGCSGKMKYRKDRFICQCGEEVEIW